MNVRAFVGGIVAVVAFSWAPDASAHVRVDSPKPRDNADNHKSGPCGGVARTGSFTRFDVGQKVTLNFTETVDHQGCYQVDLSTDGDKTFLNLGELADPPNNATPKAFSLDVNLPAGVTCKACTLRVTQLMLGRQCVAGDVPNKMSAGDTYFSCIDVCIGTDCPVAATDAGASSSSSGATSSSSSSSGTTKPPADDDDDDDDAGASSSSGSRSRSNLNNGAGNSGCSATTGEGTGQGWLALVGVAVCVAAVRSRRRS
jgi:MYXO-CTERM domain-containing protein